MRPTSRPRKSSTATGDYLIYNDEGTKLAYVDPGRARLLGVDDTTDGVMGFLYNLHLCGLACKGYAGHIGFLEKPAHIVGNDELTVGGLLALTWVGVVRRRRRGGAG